MFLTVRLACDVEIRHFERARSALHLLVSCGAVRNLRTLNLIEFSQL